jgi:hypothetical protein
MAAPRVANCIFCDDIRVEIGGKFSIMGIYGSDIIFPVAPPALLLKWGIVVWLIVDVDDKPQKMSVSVLAPPDKTEIATLNFDQISSPERQEGAIKMNFRAILPMPPVNLTEAGFIDVMVATEKETLRAGRLLVKFEPPPAESMVSAPVD